MLIEFVPPFQEFVDRYVQQAQDFLKDVHRLYGIGASLDVAGSRFAAVLVAIAFLIASSPKRISIGMSVFYIFSFMVITAIGNMIARTTIVGTFMGIAWMVIGPFIQPTNDRKQRAAGTGIAILSTIVILVVAGIMVYNAFPEVQELFRFGFEGFFSYFESHFLPI